MLQLQADLGWSVRQDLSTSLHSDAAVAVHHHRFARGKQIRHVKLPCGVWFSDLKFHKSPLLCDAVVS